MMRSMYSGVAGLKTHQTKMDVIGNNIANVNTVAYKAQSVTFSELMYQTTQNASGANTLTGTAGINARQIGLGVKMGAINTAITTEGASQTTNNPFDIRITGESFFIVSNATETFFTRDGSFYVDGVGNLAMTSNGYNVMGWQVDPETMDIKKDTVSALRVMSPENMTYPPEATTKAYVAGILDKYDTDVTSSSGKTMNLQFYDNLGYSYTAKLVIMDTAIEGEYTVTLEKVLDSDNKEVPLGGAAITSGTPVTDPTGLALTQSYKWSADGKTLLDLNDVPVKDETGADVTLAGDITPAQWKVLAKAYGFNADDAGQVSKFESMMVTASYEYTDTSVTPNEVKTATVDVKIKDILLNTDLSASLNPAPDNGKTSARDVAGVTNVGDFTAHKYTEPGSVSLKFDPTTGKFASIGGSNNTAVELNFSQLVLDDTTPVGRFSNIVVDFSNTTMFNNSGVSTITATNGDTKGLGTGRRLGQMSGISISNDGRIYASYDNGMSRLLGQIAVAQFSNASGLEKDGDNLYKATQNSGEFDGIGVDIMSDGGYMTTGILEMSNVDLSAEFTEMITTQRGFQANSRIITVSDTLLEELINLKR